MWRFIVRFFAVIGFLGVLILVAGSITVYTLLQTDDPDPPERVVLHLDLTGSVVDGPPGQRDVFSQFFGPPRPALPELVAAIDAAADDDRVVGLVAEFGGETLSAATADTLRRAIEGFQDSDKPTLAYSDAFGEIGPANIAYSLASGFDRVMMHPIGSLGLVGFHSEQIFAADALETLGVRADFVRSGPYKTLAEMATASEMSDEHREMLESLLDDRLTTLTEIVADSRGMSTGDVATLIDAPPFSAEEAEAAGLIDTLGTRADFQERKEALFGRDAETMSPADYLSLMDTEDSPQARIGVIHASGIILPGEGDMGPGSQGPATIGADRIAEEIDRAAQSGRLDGLVLRINSGGGSAIASETLGQALSRAGAAGLPTAVSMGPTAASGAYWVATYADHVVAHPETLTGSIGVVSGKVVLGDLAEALDITIESVQRGENADLWSISQPFTDNQRAWLQNHVDTLYDHFVDRVVEGRGMDREAVHDVGQGRVWTGRQALDHGLVDDLGGTQNAVAALRESLDLDADAPVALVHLPETEDFMDRLRDMIGLPDWVAANGDPAASILARLGLDIETLPPMLADPEAMTLYMPAVPDLDP